MKTFVAFLGHPRINIIDVLGPATASALFMSEHYWFSAIAFIFGVALSIMAENVFNSMNPHTTLNSSRGE